MNHEKIKARTYKLATQYLCIHSTSSLCPCCSRVAVMLLNVGDMPQNSSYEPSHKSGLVFVKSHVSHKILYTAALARAWHVLFWLLAMTQLTKGHVASSPPRHHPHGASDPRTA